MEIDNEPEQLKVNSSSSSESEGLTDASLSAYDCDSEGEEGWEDVLGESSDDEMGGTHKPRLTNLKFQLDAAKAGGYCGIRWCTMRLIILCSSEFHQ